MFIIRIGLKHNKDEAGYRDMIRIIEINDLKKLTKVVRKESTETFGSARNDVWRFL